MTFQNAYQLVTQTNNLYLLIFLISLVIFILTFFVSREYIYFVSGVCKHDALIKWNSTRVLKHKIKTHKDIIELQEVIGTEMNKKVTIQNFILL